MRLEAQEKEHVTQEPSLYGVEIRVLRGTLEVSKIRSEIDNKLIFESGVLINGQKSVDKSDGWVFLSVFSASDRQNRTSHEQALTDYQYHIYNTLKSFNSQGGNAKVRVSVFKRDVELLSADRGFAIATIRPTLGVPEQKILPQPKWVVIPTPTLTGCYLWTPIVGELSLVHVYQSSHVDFVGKWMATCYALNGGVKFCVELDEFATDEGFWSMYSN